MSASQSTELQVFSGGLKLKPAAHLIGQAEARYSANHELRRGNLTPILAPLFIQDSTDEYFFHFDDMFHFYAAWRSNTIYNNTWYSSDQFGAYKRKEGDTEDRPLGIAPPIDRLVLGTPIDPVDGDGLEGNINYVYTYYEEDTGSESPPSPPSITVDLTGINANKAIPITVVPLAGYQTRIYRIGSTGITAYSAVITLDETETTYTDELKFSEIEGMILATLRAYPPPSGLKYLTQHQGRFYGSVNSKLYFSALGKPDSWFELDFIGFDEEIMGLASTSNGLVVMIKAASWLISGNTPIQFQKHLLSDVEGCVNARSIAVSNGVAIWLSNSGFIMSNGSSLKNISLGKLGRFNSMEPFGAAVLDQIYYMSFGGVLTPSNSLLPEEGLYPASIVGDSGISLPPGAITIDLGQGEPAFSTIIDIDMKGLLVVRNELYQASKSAQQSFNRVTEDGLNNRVTESGRFNLIAVEEPTPSLSQVLNGAEFRELHYTSPLLTEGSIGMYKQYEKVRVMYSGTMIFTAYDDDKREFVSVELTSLKRITEWVNIPVGFNSGYGIQFSIVGKCVVESLMYTWTPKEVQ